MRNITVILLAAMIGTAAEVGLGVISVVTSLAQGDRPSEDVPDFIQTIHQPGFWLAGLLVDDSSPSSLILAVGITTLFFSILAFVLLRIGIGKKSNPLT